MTTTRLQLLRWLRHSVVHLNNNTHKHLTQPIAKPSMIIGHEINPIEPVEFIRPNWSPIQASIILRPYIVCPPSKQPLLSLRGLATDRFADDIHCVCSSYKTRQTESKKTH